MNIHAYGGANVVPIAVPEILFGLSIEFKIVILKYKYSHSDKIGY